MNPLVQPVDDVRSGKILHHLASLPDRFIVLARRTATDKVTHLSPSAATSCSSSGRRCSCCKSDDMWLNRVRSGFSPVERRAARWTSTSCASSFFSFLSVLCISLTVRRRPHRSLPARHDPLDPPRVLLARVALPRHALRRHVRRPHLRRDACDARQVDRLCRRRRSGHPRGAAVRHDRRALSPRARRRARAWRDARFVQRRPALVCGRGRAPCGR